MLLAKLLGIATRAIRVALPLAPAFAVQILGSWSLLTHFLLDLGGQGVWLVLRRREALKILKSNEMWVFGLVYLLLLSAQTSLAFYGHEQTEAHWYFVARDTRLAFFTWEKVPMTLSVVALTWWTVWGAVRDEVKETKSGCFWLIVVLLFLYMGAKFAPFFGFMVARFAFDLQAHQRVIIVGTELLFLVCALLALRHQRHRVDAAVPDVLGTAEPVLAAAPSMPRVADAKRSRKRRRGEKGA